MSVLPGFKCLNSQIHRHSYLHSSPLRSAKSILGTGKSLYHASLDKMKHMFLTSYKHIFSIQWKLKDWFSPWLSSLLRFLTMWRSNSRCKVWKLTRREKNVKNRAETIIIEIFIHFSWCSYKFYIDKKSGTCVSLHLQTIPRGF